MSMRMMRMMVDNEDDVDEDEDKKLWKRHEQSATFFVPIVRLLKLTHTPGLAHGVGHDLWTMDWYATGR